MNLTPDEVAEIAGRAHIASWGGVGGSGIGWLLNDVTIMLLSLLVAVASAAVSVYFRWQRNRREKFEHKRRMNVLCERSAMYAAVKEVNLAVLANSGDEARERQRVALQALREIEVTETEFGGFTERS